MKTLPSERGQAIVLIVIAIIGLFGAAALAIDLGQVYSARRNAQNAVDAAALAAAYEASAGSKDADTAVQKGYSIAETNGYVDNSETEGTVFVRVENGAFSDGPYCRSCAEGQVDDPYEYYEAQITVRLQPIFAQLIFKGMEQVTVNAIAHATPAEDATSGNALLALNEEADDAMNLDGDIKVHIVGGNMRSNGGMIKNGSSGGIKVEAPAEVLFAKDFNGNPGPFGDNIPQRKPATRIDSIPTPTCPTKAEAAKWNAIGDVKAKEDTTNNVTTYYYGSGLSVKDLPPGIHCIDGGIDKGDYTGRDVLIVLLSGIIKQTGGDSFDFRAATDIKDSNGTQYGGLVFFVPSTNQDVITSKKGLFFGGNAGGYFQGIVYAPSATCDIGGTPDGRAIHAAIICNKIKIHGNPILDIQYVPEEQFHVPPRVELVQ